MLTAKNQDRLMMLMFYSFVPISQVCVFLSMMPTIQSNSDVIAMMSQLNMGQDQLLGFGLLLIVISSTLMFLMMYLVGWAVLQLSPTRSGQAYFLALIFAITSGNVVAVVMTELSGNPVPLASAVVQVIVLFSVYFKGSLDRRGAGLLGLVGLIFSVGPTLFLQ